MESQNNYNSTFFAYTSAISRVSAQIVVPIFRNILPTCKSVADFGCAQGVWLNCWMENGVVDVYGVDGDYVDRDHLHISNECFQSQDLNEPVDLKRKFDVVYSLEVAEHLRPENSESFIKSLTNHSEIVIFSAAPPGQGGEYHINERPFESWRALFKKQGYEAYDCIRPLIADQKTVSFWYRYNIILYVHKNSVSKLSAEVIATKVSDADRIADVSPFLFKARKFIIRLLPYKVQNLIAKTKAKLGALWT